MYVTSFTGIYNLRPQNILHYSGIEAAFQLFPYNVTLQLLPPLEHFINFNKSFCLSVDTCIGDCFLSWCSRITWYYDTSLTTSIEVDSTVSNTRDANNIDTNHNTAVAKGVHLTTRGRRCREHPGTTIKHGPKGTGSTEGVFLITFVCASKLLFFFTSVFVFLLYFFFI